MLGYEVRSISHIPAAASVLEAAHGFEELRLDPWFGGRMPGAGDDDQRRFGRQPMQLIGRRRRADHVITSVDDDHRNVGQAAGVFQKLTLFQKQPLAM